MALTFEEGTNGRLIAETSKASIYRIAPLLVKKEYKCENSQERMLAEWSHMQLLSSIIGPGFKTHDGWTLTFARPIEAVEDVPQIVMEYAPGTPLHRLRGNGRISAEYRLGVFLANLHNASSHREDSVRYGDVNSANFVVHRTTHRMTAIDPGTSPRFRSLLMVDIWLHSISLLLSASLFPRSILALIYFHRGFCDFRQLPWHDIMGQMGTSLRPSMSIFFRNYRDSATKRTLLLLAYPFILLLVFGSLLSAKWWRTSTSGQ